LPPFPDVLTKYLMSNAVTPNLMLELPPFFNVRHRKHISLTVCKCKVSYWFLRFHWTALQDVSGIYNVLTEPLWKALNFQYIYLMFTPHQCSQTVANVNHLQHTSNSAATCLKKLLHNIKGLIKKFKSHQLFSFTTFKITWTSPLLLSLVLHYFLWPWRTTRPLTLSAISPPPTTSRS
jgi:hypothetical protein